MTAPSLETKNLTIRFGGHVAVDGVTCAFRPGELTAIVGPNGAGKTTYFNLMSGQLRASAGQTQATVAAFLAAPLERIIVDLIDHRAERIGMREMESPSYGGHEGPAAPAPQPRSRSV